MVAVSDETGKVFRNIDETCEYLNRAGAEKMNAILAVEERHCLPSSNAPGTSVP